MKRPSAGDLREALAQFDQLLSQRSREADFQKLFELCPYILSRSLPLRLEPSDIKPRGRPGRSEADFLIYPSVGRSTGQYGVVELKRPDTRLLVERRKGILQLSRDASTAVAQGEAYRDKIAISGDQMLILGTTTNIFIIAGLSSELGEKLRTDVVRAQFHRELPHGCQLIPYDILRDTFSQGVPPQIMVLTPWVQRTDFGELLELVEAEVYWWSRFTLTEESVSFWRDIEERSASFLPAGPSLIERERFEIAEGSFLYGELVAGGAYARSFAEQVLQLLERLEMEATDRGSQTSMTKFVASASLILRRGSGFSTDVVSQIRELLRLYERPGWSENAVFVNSVDRMTLEKQQPGWDGLVLANYVNVPILEGLDLLRPALNPDGSPVLVHGNPFHSIHPLARFLVEQ